MPEIAFIIACMQTIPLPPNALPSQTAAILSSPMAIVGPTLLLRPRHVPTEFSFSIVIGVRGIDLFRDVPAQLTWNMTTPGGDVVFSAPAIPLTLGPPSSDVTPLPIEDANAIFGLNIQNVSLPVEGHYRVTVKVDGLDIGYQEIPVRVLPKEGLNRGPANP